MATARVEAPPVGDELWLRTDRGVAAVRAWLTKHKATDGTGLARDFDISRSQANRYLAALRQHEGGHISSHTP